MTPPPSDPRTSLNRKLDLIRDHVSAVAWRYKTGLFLYGSGGLGKSFTVLNHLRKLDTPHQLCNSRMTAKGLFLLLAEAPDAVHVLEDMERITKDADAQGVLRSALWSQPGMDRVVTWTTATDGAQRVTFRGGIVMISNRPLADMPELRAMATRIEVHRLEVSAAEIETLMFDIAAMGFGDPQLLDPEKCREVTEHLLAECRAAGCPLDLRLQQKAFQTFRQWEGGHAVCHWQDLVAMSVRESAHRFQHEADPSSPEEKKQERRNILRAILGEQQSDEPALTRYQKLTGASRADYFRRLHEVRNGEFDPEAPSS